MDLIASYPACPPRENTMEKREAKQNKILGKGLLHIVHIVLPEKTMWRKVKQKEILGKSLLHIAHIVLPEKTPWRKVKQKEILGKGLLHIVHIVLPEKTPWKKEKQNKMYTRERSAPHCPHCPPRENTVEKREAKQDEY